MGLTGFHQIFYILNVAVTLYALFVMTSYMSGELKATDDALTTRIKKNRKTHTIMATILFLFVVFMPVKFESQSDAARTAVRHSFDAPVTPDREMVGTTRFNYDSRSMDKEFQDSQNEYQTKTLTNQ